MNTAVTWCVRLAAPLPATACEPIHTLPVNWTIQPEAYDYAFDKALGDAFMFYEAQRSGAISKAPGGNRIKWRADQLLLDGSDVGLDLSGGNYEAGSALPASLPVSPSQKNWHVHAWCHSFQRGEDMNYLIHVLQHADSATEACN